MSKELLVRELAAVHTNTTTITVNNSENSNNIDRFFNDTPWDLDLVAVRVASFGWRVTSLADTGRQEVVLFVAEISRQATIAQPEGIIASVRSTHFEWGNTAAAGGKASAYAGVQQMLFGNFNTVIMTLEVETNIFMNSQIGNQLDSINSIAVGEANHQLGATLYFKLGKLRKR
jgi:hypothetical protein